MTAVIHSVTNVLAEPEDHLAATGINSLNMIQARPLVENDGACEQLRVGSSV